MPLSHVYDTYAKTSKGRILHFNVVLDEQGQAKALRYARAWLAEIGHLDAVVNLENCAFCHSVEAPSAMRQEIHRQGYAIFKLEGCPA